MTSQYENEARISVERFLLLILLLVHKLHEKKGLNSK